MPFRFRQAQRSAHLFLGVLASACLSDAGERSCSCTMQVMDPFLYHEGESFSNNTMSTKRHPD